MVDGVLGIIIKDSKIFLTKRTDIPIWCLPGGDVKVKETPEKAIIREIKEETGFKATIIKKGSVFKRADFEKKKKNNQPFLCQVFVCKIKSGTFISNEEVSKVKFFPISKLPFSCLLWQKNIILNTLTNSKKKTEMNVKKELVRLIIHPLIFLKLLKWHLRRKFSYS
ncbi:hypothetical protein DRJ25_00340 [Candidatus Woesearchaeota archaeon]|nr:MAG: hypothetical protein DRJ25_00340 [Candidatus Woesearchaeota archaeon]